MKAVYAEAYGTPDVLGIREVDIPQAGEGELLIKVVAAGVSRANGMMREGKPLFGRLMLGLRRPKHPIPGSTFAGVVSAVGEGVKGFSVGDRVAGETGEKGGCFAEYLLIRESGVVSKLPNSVSFAEGAVICDGGITGYNFIAVVLGASGHHTVLINGASGAVGSSAVQIAKTLGASVTGVSSAANSAYVKSLGADRVIDYQSEDFSLGARQYDLIFDTVGNYSFKKVRRVLTRTGVYATSVLSGQILGSMLCSSVYGNQKARFSATGLAKPALQKDWILALFQMMESGTYRLEIEKTFELDQIQDACRFVDSGRKRGNVIVQISDG